MEVAPCRIRCTSADWPSLLTETVGSVWTKATLFFLVVFTPFSQLDVNTRHSVFSPVEPLPFFCPPSCCYISFESKGKAHEEQMHSQPPQPRPPPPKLTCCIVLVVVDELRDGVEVVLLCQVKLALWRGAYVIMSAASCRFPARRPVRLASSRCRRQIFTHSATSRVGRVKCYLLS